MTEQERAGPQPLIPTDQLMNSAVEGYAREIARDGDTSQATDTTQASTAYRQNSYGRSEPEDADERIREMICDSIIHAGPVDCTRIDVDVRGGVVTLRGAVADDGLRERIVTAASAVQGVADIHSELTVSNDGTKQWRTQE